MDVLQYFNQQQVKEVARPDLRAGDVVRVETKITEGEKTRLQIFEGTVLGIRGAGPSRTATVRRITGNFAVERIFPLYSPLITNIEIVKRQKVRRAKLTYLRASGRRRVKEDIDSMQRHLKTEADKKRLADDAKRRAEEEKAKAEKEAVKAEAEAERVTEKPPEQK
jgi:large subunit ribosomal protein L19